MRVRPAARLAGCHRQTLLTDVLGTGKAGRDFQYVGGVLFLHERAVIALRDRLIAERGAEQGAA